jgi:hypothetical protein
VTFDGAQRLMGSNPDSSLGAARPLPPSADIGLHLLAAVEAPSVLAGNTVDASGFHRLA